MAEPGQEEAVKPSLPARTRRRRWPLLAGAGVIAATGMLALITLDRPAGEASRLVATEVQDTASAAAPDPLRAELVRCRTLPPGADDAACHAAWDESRRQFFGEPRAPRPAGERPLPDPVTPVAASRLSAATASPAQKER